MNVKLNVAKIKIAGFFREYTVNNYKLYINGVRIN